LFFFKTELAHLHLDRPQGVQHKRTEMGTKATVVQTRRNCMVSS